MLRRNDEREATPAVALRAEAPATEVLAEGPEMPKDSADQPMLQRLAATPESEGLAEEMAPAVHPRPQRHRAWRSILAPRAGVGLTPQGTWVVAVAAMLVVALSAVALVGSELVGRPERSNVASPAAVVAPTTGPSPSVAATSVLSAAPAVVTSRSPVGQLRELAFAPDGSAWLATGGGVVHWDVAGGTATLYGQGDGLPTTEAVHVAIGPEGAVWASGPAWVGRYDGSWTVFTEFGATVPGPDLGDIAVGPDGALWIGATDTATFTPVLLRYDGAWSSYELPEAINPVPWTHRLLVGADGVVWAASWDRFFRFEKGRWATYTRASTGLPRDPVLTAVTADGSVWVTLDAEGCVAAAGGGATCATPAAGVARLHDGTWTVYSTNDGLPANDAALVAGPAGAPWAAAGAEASRFDGTTWTTTSLPMLADARLAAVDPHGTLWFETSSGTDFLAFDGSTLTRRVLPPIAVPSTLPQLHLTELSGPTVTTSAFGMITWRVYEGMTGAEYWRMTGTRHGPVALVGPDLRWISGVDSLAGTTLPAEAWAVTSLGDEVVAHGPWVARLRWDGARWAAVGEEGATIGLAGFVEQFIQGPRGTIATGAETIWFSADGRHFATAAHGPDKKAGEKASRAAGGIGACPSVGSGEWPGLGRLGPALATKEGFVILAPALVSDWNKRPLCAPLLWSSPDGSRWTLVSGRSPFGAGAIVEAVASRDGRHVAVGQAGADAAAWVSDDGLSWRRVSLDRAEPCDVVGGVSACSGLMAGVQAAEEGWLAWSWDGAAWSSRDGEVWSQIEGWPGIRGGYGGPNLALGGGYILATGSLPGPWHEAIAIGRISP